MTLAGELHISSANVMESRVRGKQVARSMAGLIARASRTVLRAAADFAHATDVGRGQLAKRDSVRKGLPGAVLGLCVQSLQRKELLVGVEVAAVGAMPFLGGVRVACSNPEEEDNQGDI